MDKLERIKENYQDARENEESLDGMERAWKRSKVKENMQLEREKGVDKEEYGRMENAGVLLKVQGLA